MVNKTFYAVSSLSYVLGIWFIDKDSAFQYFYFSVLPACAIIIVLFNLIVDNSEKLKEGNLFVFFYLLISIFYSVFLVIDSSNLIAIICLIISSSSALLARKTDRYWARKDIDS